MAGRGGQVPVRQLQVELGELVFGGVVILRAGARSGDRDLRQDVRALLGPGKRQALRSRPEEQVEGREGPAGEEAHLGRPVGEPQASRPPDAALVRRPVRAGQELGRHPVRLGEPAPCPARTLAEEADPDRHQRVAPELRHQPRRVAPGRHRAGQVLVVRFLLEDVRPQRRLQAAPRRLLYLGRHQSGHDGPRRRGLLAERGRGVGEGGGQRGQDEQGGDEQVGESEHGGLRGRSWGYRTSGPRPGRCQLDVTELERAEPSRSGRPAGGLGHVRV